MPLIVIGDIFWRRYNAGHRAVDLDRAISTYEESVRLTQDLDPEQADRLFKLGVATVTRFENAGEPSDIQKACSSFEGSLFVRPHNASACTTMGHLGNALISRFECLGDIEDVGYAIAVLKQALEFAPDDDPDRPNYLTNLGSALELRYRHMDDASDLEDSIKYKQEAVELTPDGHPNKPGRLNNLGIALRSRFTRFGHIPDLDASH